MEEYQEMNVKEEEGGELCLCRGEERNRSMERREKNEDGVKNERDGMT